MNRLKSYALFSLSTLVLLLFAAPALAGSAKGASLTVYNSGRALVKETRTVNLPKGLASVVFKDVPRTMDPTSVHASAKGMKVFDLQYSYNPITTKNLLDSYVGKELTVILPDPAEVNGRILKKGTLLSNVDKPIFMVGNEVYVGNYSALLLPELPKDLQREATLTLTTDNQAAAKRGVLLSYLMGGIQWRADYTLTLDSKGETCSLDAWATITNTSGRAFSNTALKLVAGDVQRANGGRRNVYAKSAVMMESAQMDAMPAPVEEQFSQYHVYTVPRKVELAPSGTKQLSLFYAPKVKVEQELVSRFDGNARRYGGKTKQAVSASLKLINIDKNGLGRPMPGGLVRVFMPTKDGSQLLAGESQINHVGRGSEVRLSLGRAFDVKVERSQTVYKKLGKQSFEMSWSIKLINGKDKAQAIKLRDTYSGQWKVISADAKYAKPDAGSIEFDLTVPPTKNGTPMVVNYTVQVTY